MSGATISIRPTYMSNPLEIKELRKQVGELMEKGYVGESMSPLRFKDESFRGRGE